MATSATLDSTEKQCCVRRTDGEELKNRSRDLPSRDSIVALFFGTIKGKPGKPGGWDKIPPTQNLRTGSGSSRMGLKIQDGLLTQVKWYHQWRCYTGLSEP